MPHAATRWWRAPYELVAAGMLLAAAAAACSSDTAPTATSASSSSPPTSITTTVPPTRTEPTSATTTTAPVAAAGPLTGRVIVVDPGHNEHNAQHPTEINRQVDVVTEKKACDTTGTATDDGYAEASFTTDVAARVAGRLRELGATVVLTRDVSTPWGPCVTERAAIGNDAHADAAISIHADGGPADGHGFHVIAPLLVAGHNDAIVEPSAALAVDVRDAYRTSTGLAFSTYLGHDGLDYRDDLGGLNLSTVPKVFIECGNMRNASDAVALEDPAFRARIANGIAAGLAAFIEAR